MGAVWAGPGRVQEVRGHFEKVEELGGGVWGRGERGERVAEEHGASLGEALLAEGLREVSGGLRKGVSEVCS